MSEHTTIELFKENMKFSAGHFTLFSATEREPIHGHNFTVYVAIDTNVNSNGLTFDYRYYKKFMCDLCKSLSHTFLVPEKSEYLNIEVTDEYYYLHFNQEKIPFLKKDATLMPLRNISVEELSAWFVEKVIADPQRIQDHKIEKVLVKVFSSPGQCGSSTWEKEASS